MRLTRAEQELIRSSIIEIDPDAEIRLFGSRVNKAAKGGDIDILCISIQIDRHHRRRLKRELSDRLGGQRIDLVVARDHHKPFVRLILPESAEL